MFFRWSNPQKSNSTVISCKKREQGLCQRGKQIAPRDEVRDFEELSVRTRQRFDLGWTTGAG
jgi:hypothetical protein